MVLAVLNAETNLVKLTWALGLVGCIGARAQLLDFAAPTTEPGHLGNARQAIAHLSDSMPDINQKRQGNSQ